MSPIERARKIINDRLYQPALASNTVSQQTKNNTKNEEVWLKAFQYVGDLLDYLKRFNDFEDSDVYRDLKANGIETYEDIYPELERDLRYWSQERLRLDDFIIGNAYNSRTILISAKTYDTRASGILPVGNKPNYDYVVIKATLEGGKYPNEWVDSKKELLKYYFKSISGVTKRHYKENSSILDNHNIDIFVFVRQNPSSPFIFEGKFKYKEDHEDQSDGSMFFILQKTSSNLVMNEDLLNQQLKHEVQESLSRSSSERKSRLASATKKPDRIAVMTTAYKRNADVIAEVLERAKGICEGCDTPAPFIRSRDGTPYLEVHHKKRLADGGDDTVENALALCPNCHREAHFG